MHLVLLILIAAALASGVYAVAVQRGANVVHFNRRLTAIVLIAGSVLPAAAVLGYPVGQKLLDHARTLSDSLFLIRVLAGVLLAGIGIRMLMKAFRHKTIPEHRMEQIDLKHDVLLVLRLCADSAIAGISCGILHYHLLSMIAAVFAAAALSAVCGYLSGRAYGGGQSSRAYIFGGSVLCAVSIVLQFVRA